MAVVIEVFFSRIQHFLITLPINTPYYYMVNSASE